VPTELARAPRSRAISGLLQAERGEVTRGEIKFLSQTIDQQTPQARVRLGIAQVLEGRRVFEHLTPDENLVAASAVRGGRADMNRNCATWSTAISPDWRSAAPPNQATCQAASSRCWPSAARMMTQPKLLMLDEPSLGLAPFLVAEIFDIVRQHQQSRRPVGAAGRAERNCRTGSGVTRLPDGERPHRHARQAEAMKKNPDIQEFYLGGAEGKDFHDIKHYRRRKRWLS
jgi:branched-chain amino acid transport system ATP-binding protein